MPVAGFYEIRSSKISFGRDGRWYADGEVIPNRRINRLFSRHLRRKADGSYELAIGPDRTAVEVEDTPYVVEALESDAEGGFDVILNDDTREPLALDTLAVGARNVLYCRVKGASERARFLRPAYYQLAPFLEETEGGRFTVCCAGRRYRIARE